MAELDTSSGGSKKGGKVRSKKQSTRVDLTAMVDLAFLLITFFMLTTTLAKPQAMDMTMPDKAKKDQQQLKLASDRTLNVLLGANNRIVYYMGKIDDKPTPVPTVTNYGADIRKVLMETDKTVQNLYFAKEGVRDKGVIVLVKPSDKSIYRNYVDIMDELKIADIKAAPAVMDLSAAEKTLVKDYTEK